jgi:hypothetical protein
LDEHRDRSANGVILIGRQAFNDHVDLSMSALLSEPDGVFAAAISAHLTEPFL